MAVPITARMPVEFPPPALSETKPDVRIICRVPTMFERDTYGAMLIRNGWVSYARRQIRELCLAGAESLIALEDQPEAFTLLEEMWAEKDARDKQAMAQGQRLLELTQLPDWKKWTKEEVEEELSKITCDVEMNRDRRIKATGYQNQIMGNYEPLMSALASSTEQDSKRYWISISHYVVDWTGLEHRPECADKSIDAGARLKRHEAEYLRSQIGEDAWEQTGEFIDSMMGLSDDDQKNLDSLLASLSDQTGSKSTAESKGSNEPGNSTDESGTQIPALESPTTIESSNNSTDNLPPTTDESQPGPTDAP